MGLLDWIRNRPAQNAKQPETEVFLSQGERAALGRTVQHFYDGLMGWQPGKPREWEADLDATVTRLGFRDPFGNKPVRLEPQEAEAVRKLQAACEKDAESGNYQVQHDIQAIKEALERNGKPQPLPAGELTHEAAPPVPSPPPAPKEPGSPFERGDRVIADERFYYGGKPKGNPYSPGIVDGVYDGGKMVCYERLGSPPGNSPAASVRHANSQDMKKYEKEFDALEAKVQQQSRGPSWDR